MEEEKKGFTVKDKRIFGETGETRSEETPEVETPKAEMDEKSSGEGGGEQREEERAGQRYTPEVNFYNFVISLSTSAIFHFGDFPDPETKQGVKNIPAAKQIIDTLSMLKKKTEGNLDENEKSLLDGVLYELRMRYVKEK